MDGILKTKEGEAFNVLFPHKSKTKNEGFSFLIPGKYRNHFVKYNAQLKPGYSKTYRYLKTSTRDVDFAYRTWGEAKWYLG